MLRVLPLLIISFLLSSGVFAQEQSKEAVLKKALSAAPAPVAEKATVMEWDSKKVLREGTNGYFCFPSMPGDPYPMCVDEPWVKLLEALVKEEKPPAVTRIAVGYWLQGAFPISNEDPFATGEELAKHVKFNGEPHIAILVPDRKMLESLPTDPTLGRPWVMWKNTPYAHIMVLAPHIKD